MPSTVFPRYLDVPVTDEDLRNGKRGLCEDCPVALALQRRLPPFRIQVFTDRAFVGEMVYQLTRQARALVLAFDKGQPVRPQTVRLYNPKKRIMG
jgi:hypothetical protein